MIAEFPVARLRGFEPPTYRLGVHPRAVFQALTKSKKASVFKAFQPFYCYPITRFFQLRTAVFKWFLRRVLSKHPEKWRDIGLGVLGLLLKVESW